MHIPIKYPNTKLDKYIIMPNHVHILIEIVGAGFSRPDTIMNNKNNDYVDNGINKIWQRSFYDHIIRNDKSLNKIREYIINNPATWDTDEHNPKKVTVQACLNPTG